MKSYEIFESFEILWKFLIFNFKKFLKFVICFFILNFKFIYFLILKFYADIFCGDCQHKWRHQAGSAQRLVDIFIGIPKLV